MQHKFIQHAIFENLFMCGHYMLHLTD